MSKKPSKVLADALASAQPYRKPTGTLRRYNTSGSRVAMLVTTKPYVDGFGGTAAIQFEAGDTHYLVVLRAGEYVTWDPIKKD